MQFFESLEAKGLNLKGLTARIRNPIHFRPSHGGRAAYGYEATILADICDLILEARKIPGVKIHFIAIMYFKSLI